MQDKFENNMGKKLEELNFVPSGKVWDNIERELKKDKRPRIAAWWWMLPLVILLGWGTYSLLVADEDRQQKSTTTENATGNNDAGNSTQLKVSPENNVIVQNQEPPARPAVSSAINNAPADIAVNKKSSIINAKNQLVFNQPARKTGKTISHTHKKPGTFKDKAASSIRVNAAELSEEPEVKEITPPAAATVQARENPQPDKLSSVAKTAGNKKESQEAAPLKKPEKKAGNKNNVSKWQIGLVANTGIASINKIGSFKQNEASIFYSNTNNPGTATPGLIVSNSYKINNGVSFSGGLVARKSLSRKFQAGSGILYNHTSISVTRVQKTDSISASGSGVILNTKRMDTYHENLRLHFFDIPLSTGFTILDNKNIQLNVNAALINRFLISGNWNDYETILGKKKPYTASFQLNPVVRFSKWQQFSFGPYAELGLSKMETNKRFMNAGLSFQYFIKK
ncbi:MAG: hypothetical protein WAT19_01370 [Ferruginibacter sp.]